MLETSENKSREKGSQDALSLLSVPDSALPALIILLHKINSREFRSRQKGPNDWMASENSGRPTSHSKGSY